MSLNVEAADMSLGAVFASMTIPFINGDSIKSQFAFSEYYQGFGFFGYVITISTQTMYKVKKGSASSFVFTGEVVSLPLTVTFTAGWNYVPCPYQVSTALGQAFGSLALASDDTLKSQTAFTTYYVGFGWFGQLSSLEPGQGYKMKTAGGGPATFGGLGAESLQASPAAPPRAFAQAAKALPTR